MNISVQSMIHTVSGYDFLKHGGINFFTVFEDGHFSKGETMPCMKLIQVLKICDTLELAIPNISARKNEHRARRMRTRVNMNSWYLDSFRLGPLFFIPGFSW